MNMRRSVKDAPEAEWLLELARQEALALRLLFEAHGRYPRVAPLKVTRTPNAVYQKHSQGTTHG